jgi:hypothetical protein
MSREERRQYQRQMKSLERGPSLPPAAQARAERNASRRAARRKPPAAPGSFTRRFWVLTTLIALGVGYVAFSTQWPRMPWALYVGLATGAAAFAVQVGIRYIQRRTAAPP